MLTHDNLVNGLCGSGICPCPGGELCANMSSCDDCVEYLVRAYEHHIVDQALYEVWKRVIAQCDTFVDLDTLNKILDAVKSNSVYSH